MVRLLNEGESIEEGAISYTVTVNWQTFEFQNLREVPEIAPEGTLLIPNDALEIQKIIFETQYARRSALAKLMEGQ